MIMYVTFGSLLVPVNSFYANSLYRDSTKQISVKLFHDIKLHIDHVAKIYKFYQWRSQGIFQGGRNVPGGARITKLKLFRPKKAFPIERHLKKCKLFSMLGWSQGGGATAPPCSYATVITRDRLFCARALDCIGTKFLTFQIQITDNLHIKWHMQKSIIPASYQLS